MGSIAPPPPPSPRRHAHSRRFARMPRAARLGSACVAAAVVGVVLALTLGSSTTWTDDAAPLHGAVDIDAISCAPAGYCMAVASDATILVRDAGTSTWRVLASAPSPTGTQPYLSVDCVGQSTCLLGTAGSIDRTVDGGRTWHTELQIAANHGAPYDFGAVSCTAQGACVALAGVPAFLHDRLEDFGFPSPSGRTLVASSHDAGRTWTTRTVALGFIGLSCPRRQACEAATAAGLYRTRDAGRSWSRQATITARGTRFTTIACEDRARCMAGDSSGGIWWTTDGGSHWATRHPGGLGTPAQSIAALACLTAEQCVAIGAGVPSTPEGTTWPSPVVVATGDFGATWAVQSMTGGVGHLDALACAAGGACVAGGDTNAADPSEVTGVLVSSQQ